MSLPHAHDEAGWHRLLADDAALGNGVDTLMQRHRLASSLPVQRYGSGSLPVYALGDAHVLKLFPPPDAEHAGVEARVLSFVDARLPVPTPQLRAHGELDGWHYLLMSRLRGHRLVDVWAQLSAQQPRVLAAEVGEAIAALHGLDSAPLGDLPPSWPQFITAQRLSAVERQRNRGLAAPWLAQIEPFLARWAAPVGNERVLLHTEVMREHLLAEPVDDGWRLSGLFDFEPAMRGEREYEFSSIGLFVACGDGGLLRRVLQAYGHADSDLTEALQYRLMAQALLHRYSNLRWYLQRLPLPRATTLEELARHWWAIDGVR
ncbi:MAG: aminoglycoside 3'-phosphotransferase/choline kinase family protein [Rubrivivax sp.]